MSNAYNAIPTRTRGAWVIHHGRKARAAIKGGSTFPALETAGQAASLLSSLAATDEITMSKKRVDALSQAAGFNPMLELPRILEILQTKRLIDKAKDGSIVVVGLTTSATAGHASEIFEELDPSNDERASIVAAEATTDSPIAFDTVAEFLGDEFKLSRADRSDLLQSATSIGFVDSEGAGADRLVFNGNVFRRGTSLKVKRILDSVKPAEAQKVSELETELAAKGCVTLQRVLEILGAELFDKLRAAGMYDLEFVQNPNGEFGFVTRPSAFHKFNDPMVDDVFDLAKALVAALFYGMNQSASSRGKITMISALLRNLIAGQSVGPATAIGQDYKVLEEAGVLQTWPDKYGYSMKLLKKDVGEMALTVLTKGDVSSDNASTQPLVGSMQGFVGPETSRWNFRGKQTVESKKATRNVLESLRTGVRF
ncbi:MAG: hypothetical protein LH610_03935 [Sphingomonas bacterium]|nr:hypothetical protein [Sphingomonas bacterium]